MEVVRGGVTSGVGGLEGRRGVRMPVDWFSDRDEMIFCGVCSSPMLSS